MGTRNEPQATVAMAEGSARACVVRAKRPALGTIKASHGQVTSIISPISNIFLQHVQESLSHHSCHSQLERQSRYSRPSTTRSHLLSSSRVSSRTEHTLLFTRTGRSTTQLSKDGPHLQSLWTPYGTAITACRIIACNRPGYLTTVDGKRIEIEVIWDLILTDSDYFFNVNTDLSISDPVINGHIRYAVCPTFQAWRFPHKELPAQWVSGLSTLSVIASPH